MGDTKDWNLLAARAARAGGTGGRGGAGSTAADDRHERLIEINATVAHIANLLCLGERIRDIARLACGTCLQNKGRCAGEHRGAERCTPPCRVVAARIGGDNAFSRSGKGDHAGAKI